MHPFFNAFVERMLQSSKGKLLASRVYKVCTQRCTLNVLYRTLTMHKPCTRTSWREIHTA
eukprot:scaffold23344_cov19-Tisochrysis_lutea.AAC.2